MASQADFENRRRERHRRERLRKKRIRAAIMSIALICVIALGCAAVSTMIKNKNEAENYASTNTDNNINVTSSPEAANPEAEQTNGTENNPQNNESQAVTVSSIPSPSKENDLLRIIADSGQQKRCYLTFDDGPTENITPQILDTLRKYNAKATFFMVGSMINSNPDMARRVYEEGHLLANHSQGHNYDKLYATKDSFMTEVLNCEDSIRSVMDDGDEPFKLIRFPGGSYNAGDHAAEKQEYKEVLKENGYYYCDWNALNGDAEGKTKNASELLEYLKQTSQGYNNLIVLMHDAATKQATADALPSIIEYLTEQGYTFHSLDDIEYQTAPAQTQSAEGANDTGDTSQTANS